jgi:hypothetical protein
MELWQVALPVADDADLRRVLALLHELRVPLNPCAGDPVVRVGPDGRQRLVVLATPRVLERLREQSREVEVVRDLATLPDPRRYVSTGNRYEAALAALRARKPRR